MRIPFHYAHVDFKPAIHTACPFVERAIDNLAHGPLTTSRLQCARHWCDLILSNNSSTVLMHFHALNEEYS